MPCACPIESLVAHEMLSGIMLSGVLHQRSQARQLLPWSKFSKNSSSDPMWSTFGKSWAEGVAGQQQLLLFCPCYSSCTSSPWRSESIGLQKDTEYRLSCTKKPWQRWMTFDEALRIKAAKSGKDSKTKAADKFVFHFFIGFLIRFQVLCHGLAAKVRSFLKESRISKGMTGK